MIVYSGRGYLIVLILLLTMFLCISIFPDDIIDLCFIIPLIISGLFSFILGLKWNKNQKSNFNSVTKTSYHTLFWVRMEYWGVISNLFALIIAFQNLKKTGFEFIAVILLIIIGVASLLFYSYILFYGKLIALSKDSRTDTIKNEEKVEIKPSFIKEDLKELDNEIDHNKYMPK